MMPKTLTKEQVRYYDDHMSSYPAFARWTQEEKPDFVVLAGAFRYELNRDLPRRQILTRIIQIYNTQLTRANWEQAMSMVSG